MLKNLLDKDVDLEITSVMFTPTGKGYLANIKDKPNEKCHYNISCRDWKEIRT
jgi:hypothetical protein